MIVYHFVAPREKLTSRYECGTARMASSAVRKIVGRIIKAIVSPPDKTDQPKLRYITKKINPKSPYSMEGKPARDSALKQIMRVTIFSVDLKRLNYHNK